MMKDSLDKAGTSMAHVLKIKLSLVDPAKNWGAVDGVFGALSRTRAGLLLLRGDGFSSRARSIAPGGMHCLYRLMPHRINAIVCALPASAVGLRGLHDAEAREFNGERRGAAQQDTYDLLLTGGHVIDPANEIDGVRDVAIRNGRIARVAASISAAVRQADAST